MDAAGPASECVRGERGVPVIDNSDPCVEQAVERLEALVAQYAAGEGNPPRPGY